ncbi:Glycosyltransferase involved in cell wall bisynthesis [Pedobacter westerhofensis]|uniref:Glycosyltransferase involved in cell wall bisynthesis n=1 Tax=Pedobacter westerhofensis TaxID=425512 RepID=A0A521E4H1_9SPHI|nr:glycosyltransferase [Pedobacter westerhofensis]SMO78826.1 Glycosyltransferase involved in cell wall bisynthesis [Pedobacter westerhofensis]
MIKEQYGVSVIMPTYNQGAFIRGALTGLFEQTFENWELIIINDGSTDYTEQVIAGHLTDARVRYFKNEQNKGLGYCLNLGIAQARHTYICYLPSDDIIYKNHLQSLYEKLTATRNAVLSYAGACFHNNDSYATGLSTSHTLGNVPGRCLQLVQIMHKTTTCRWSEREVLVTVDLDVMFLNELRQEGAFVATRKITCEWVNHPFQRHKIINKKEGGSIHFYKNYYGVDQRLKFYSDGVCLDENKPVILNQINAAPGKLKIIVVGELGFNPERLAVLEEEGHQLFGIWIRNPDIHNSVGPFAFGNIIELDLNNLQSQIAEINPDLIYALLNTQAVKLAHTVMLSNPGIPFIWHFKEGPFFCRNAGLWNDLVELYYNADGRIFINQECRDWFEQFIGDHERPSYILDGDLPPANWFTTPRWPLLSADGNCIHTVMIGRPYGISPDDIAELAKHRVHFHLYGKFYQTKWHNWVKAVNELVPGHLHLHEHCEPDQWAEELSMYDAGWLHCFTSKNQGDISRCDWNDLNLPARMATLAVAGLPMIQKANKGHIVASESILRQLNIGVLYTSYNDLAKQLHDQPLMEQKRKQVWENRMCFSFDYHLKGLTDFFNQVIASAQ